MIGGSEIYGLALPVARHLYLTRVHVEVQGDAHLPAIDWQDWVETQREAHPAADGRPGYTFLEYTRRMP